MKKSYLILFLFVFVFSFLSSVFLVNECMSQVAQNWAVRYNGPANGHDYGYQMVVDIAGNLYVTGEGIGTGTGLDILTIKYNSAGVQQWLSRYNNTTFNNDDRGFAISVDASGNVYVAGLSTGSGGPNTGQDYITVKYNSSGVQQWAVI